MRASESEASKRQTVTLRKDGETPPRPSREKAPVAEGRSRNRIKDRRDKPAATGEGEPAL